MSSLTSLLTKNNTKPKEKYGRLITVIDELFVEHTMIDFTIFTNWYVYLYIMNQYKILVFFFKS